MTREKTRARTRRIFVSYLNTSASRWRTVTFLVLFALASVAPALHGAQEQRRRVPDHIPPKRSSQIESGFGVNSDLPRDPYLPWNRWWWTRMFDAGVSWIRIGQYENSSEPVSWDWVERKRGTYQIAPEVDDYVDSLVENGVKVQLQLLYGNPMYTSPAGRRPDSIIPKPGSFHNDDRSLYSIFWPPKTPEQIDAFMKYVSWTVGHFRGRIRYYALWNEEDIGYWSPWGNPEEYGRLLKAFAPAVHAADPQAKVIYGAQADPSREFTKRALDTCQCASQIDVYAYHTYPGYGQNMNPETMDYGAYGMESPSKLRDLVRHYPGIKSDIEFWDDEFNSIPAWRGMDESVQAKYVPRGLIYNWASGVRTFIWLLASALDGNEGDDFGLIHGLRYLPDDFTPRRVLSAVSNTDSLFSDTKLDSSIGIASSDIPGLRRQTKAPFLAYGFRSKTGKGIVAYWLAAHSVAGDASPPFTANLTLRNTGIEHPVLIDVTSGAISTVQWHEGTPGQVDAVPVRDSIIAIADESYFDWDVLPEAPSGAAAVVSGGSVKLTWQMHGGDSTSAIIERRIGSGGWERISTQPASRTEYTDTAPPGHITSYRVRASNHAGTSAYSNIARVTAGGK